jgi:pimeloyl-ACP methyl ester carboxylesterase
VLLRGLSRSREHWGDFVERFRAAEGAVLAPDLPGAGVHHQDRSPAAVAALLAAVRAEVGGGRRWLVGLSLGGMIAQEWMRLHPGEVAGAVLINTSAGGLVRPWQRIRPSAAAQILAAMATPEAWSRERRIHALTSNRSDADGVVRRWVALAQRQPVRRGNVLRQLLAAARYRANHQAPRIPTLVLTSRHDRLVDPACSRALAMHLGATLHQHPSAGHDLPLDDPDWVLARIGGWASAHDR